MRSTIAFVALVTLSIAACGPSGYIKNVTMNASSSVAAAKAVDADKWAPYEYTRAVEFLHKAKEEASYADFQAANRFGKLAHKAAKQAKKLAVERSANKNDTSWLPPPSLRDKAGSSSSNDKGDGGMAPADPDTDQTKGETDGKTKGETDGKTKGGASQPEKDAAGDSLAPVDAGDDNNTSGDTP